MEHTEGLGRKAEVWVNGELLTVCDGISPRDRRLRPGPLEAVKLTYLREEGTDFRDLLGGNKGDRRRLDPVRGWSYAGYGKILSVLPVLIDFGLLCMDDPEWTTDESLVGRFVRVPIDRLEIVPARRADWPEHVKRL